MLSVRQDSTATGPAPVSLLQPAASTLWLLAHPTAPRYMGTDTPVEDAVSVHVVECLHELVHVGAHTVLCKVVAPAPYQLIDVHVLTAYATINSTAMRGKLKALL